MKRFCLILVLALVVFVFVAPANAVDVHQVQRVLRATGAEWTAGVTSVSHLSPAEMARYCNLQIMMPEGADAYEEPLEVPTDIPAHLDWRDIDGQDFTTPIEDQGNCGTCATFSSIGAFEALIKVALNNPFIQPDLSEQAVYACEGFLPYTFFHPMAYLKKSGAPDMVCMPYECDGPGDRPPCEDQCDDWQSRAFKTTDYRMMMFPSPDQIKAALQKGPIVAGFQVFEDFQAYTGGVYVHKTGRLLGGHGVAVVGYDDAGQYWICKNSWGPNWGEKGWFKIKWGSGLLGFGYQSFAIDVDAQTLCADEQAPVISDAMLANEEAILGQDEDLQVTFGYFDLEAHLAGGELWYSLDGGDEERYESPLVELTGTSSAGRDAAFYALPGTAEPGEHALRIYVKDLCGKASNEMSITFTVEGEVSDDDGATDDDATDDDQGGDDDQSGVGDDDDDDNGGGCL